MSEGVRELGEAAREHAVTPLELFFDLAFVIARAGFLSGDARIAAWTLALAVDYVGPSVIAIGVGAGLTLSTGVIVGAGCSLPSCIERPGGSSGDERSAQSSCSPSCRQHLQFRHSPRSALSAACAHSSSLTKPCDTGRTG